MGYVDARGKVPRKGVTVTAFTLSARLLTVRAPVINLLFTTRREMCACRPLVVILFRVFDGLRSTGTLANEALAKTERADPMDSKRSYLDTLNTGRQRRSQASLDELTRTLAELESSLPA